MPQSMIFPVLRAGAAGKTQIKELATVCPAEFVTVLRKTGGALAYSKF